MDSINQYQKLNTYKQLQEVYNFNYGLGCNNSESIQLKFNTMYALCFLTQEMKRAKPDKFNDCVDVLSTIFNKQLKEIELNSFEQSLVSFGLLCNDLLYNVKNVEKPEGVTNLLELKNIILNYFNNEWMPF